MVLPSEWAEDLIVVITMVLPAGVQGCLSSTFKRQMVDVQGIDFWNEPHFGSVEIGLILGGVLRHPVGPHWLLGRSWWS